MRKKMNRFLALLMALVMVFSLMPIGVIATDAPVENIENIETTVHPNASDSYSYASNDNSDDTQAEESIFSATIVETGENYESLKEAVEAANKLESATIQLLKSIDLAEKLTITGDVTLDGSGYTITRGKLSDGNWYTGTLFSVSANASLTLDGGVTIDGGNNWVFKLDDFNAAQVAFRQDNNKSFSFGSFYIMEDGAPIATENAFSVFGQLNLNSVTIENHAGQSFKGAILLNSTGSLTMNKGSLLQHNFSYGSASAVYMLDNSVFQMNGGMITGHFGNLNGPCIYNNGGIMTMNGGKINNNYIMNGNGSAIMLFENEATFIMNDGEICGNSAVRSDRSHCGAVYVHSTGIMEMHGGSICHNTGVSVGGIHFNNQNAKITITDGFIIENENQLTSESWAQRADIYPVNQSYVSGGVCTNDLGHFVVDGYGVAIDRKTINGKEYIYYTVSDQLIELKSNGQIYPTFDAAMADAADGDTLTVLRDQRVIVDATKSETTVLDKNVTIDFNGKTVYGWGGQNPVFRILADVTFTGNGTMDTVFQADACCAVIGNDQGQSGKLTVKDGTYLGDTSVFSVANGELNIEGGYFQAEPSEGSYEYTLDCDETAYANGSASISCTGGTFYGFDPEDCTTESAGTNFCAPNYISEDNGNTTWTVVPDYVAKIVETGELYQTLSEAVADANGLGIATIELLKNSTLGEELTVTGNVTIDGSGYTITRADTHTGTLFAVNAGATLTLDGGLVIDGGNNWTYKDTDNDGTPDLKTVVDNYSARVPYSKHSFITYESGAPVATESMIRVSGSVVTHDVIIQNNVGTCIASIGDGGKLTTNSDTVFFHNAGSNGTIVYMSTGSEFNMNGSTISQTVGDNHGGCVQMNGGTFTMNGGLVQHSYTTGQGSFLRLNAGKFIMKDGDILQNVCLPFGTSASSNNIGAAIDNTRNGVVEIHDGTISHNYGYWEAGINNVGTKLTITGGTFVNNTAWAARNGQELDNIGYQNTSGESPHVTEIRGGIFGTEVYSACAGGDSAAVTPPGYEEFVIGWDEEGNPNLWEVAPGWIITFVDEDGTTVLQTGPVREGEIPVFEGEIESRGESWGWSWEPVLAPATEAATYTLVWTHYVAAVVKPGSTEPPVRYTTLKDAIKAAEDGDTVRLLEDIPLAEKLTVDGKAITLDGNGHTITRGKLSTGKWYTGTLFTVNAGASLTLDGDIIFDGGNNWTFKEEEYNAALEYEMECDANGIKPPEYKDYAFATSESGAPTGTARMFVINGNFAINKATIQNSYGGGITQLKANATMSINAGALIQHCAYNSNGSIVSSELNSHLIINEGAKITENYIAKNGGIFRVNGGTVTMNGGTIQDNFGVNTNGTVIMLHNGDGIKSSFIMNDGLICGNSSLIGSGAGWCNPIYLHKGGYMEMHGGTICHNSGYQYGGINTNQTTTQLIITRGNVYYNTQRGHSYAPGFHDVGTQIANTGITGGWYSQDVSKWVPETHAVIVHDFVCDEDGTCDGHCECTCGYVCEADSKRENCTTLYQVAPVIKITMDDQVIIDGDPLPELTYTINYGIVELNAVEVEVYPATVENPVVGENVITTSGKLHDKEDEAIYYALKIIPGKLTVLPKPECAEDTIVVDFGLPVSIDVMTNDPVPNSDSTLVGLSLTAPADMWPVTDSINQQPADGFVTELETGLKYGTAKVEDGKVIYTTNTMAMPGAEVFYYALQYTGDLYRPGYYYGKVTVIPATSIYYEDNFLDYEAFTMAGDTPVDDSVVWEQSSPSGELAFPELDADRIYGNNPAYSNSTTYSLGSHYQAKVNAEHYGTAKFDFWGTGFDLISACTFDTGTLMVSVYNKAAFDSAQGKTTAQKMQNIAPVAVQMVDTYWGYALSSDGQWVPSQSSDALYQIPVIKMDLAEYGNYTVVITASYMPFFDHNKANADYLLYIDAIRIYDPANDGADDPVIEDAYVADGEGWPTYYELRNLILDAGTFDSLNEEDQINGIVYIDGNTALDGEAAISDYTNFGPNNELYLGKGQGVSFILPDEENIDRIHLAMKLLLSSANSAQVKVFAAGEDINEVEAIQLTSATDLYYDISHLKGETIVIYNASDAEDIISITNIKITHTAKPTSTDDIAPFTVTKQGTAMALRSLRSYLPEIQEPQQTNVWKWNIVLGDDIGANFYVEAPENGAASAVKVTVAGRTETYDLSALTPNEEGLYKISVNVAAAQMTEDITLQMVVDGTEYDPVSYSIQDYAKVILTGEYPAETKNLVKHMLDYGTAAQNYFGVKTDDLANAGNEIAYMAEYPAEYPQLAVNGKIGGIRFYGASLVFESKVALRYYFEADSVEGVIFTVNGISYLAVEKDGKFYVEIPNIAPYAYGDAFVLSAQKDGQAMEVSYSPMTYMVRMSQKGQENLKALMDAMYGYYEAAVAYEQQAD